MRAAFLAGYQAAKDQLQPQPFHAGADVYIIDANNPLPKPMPLSIAEQYQFADTSKVMNSPEKLDSCEHILDMKQMVDVNFSNNSNGWISVKERLPETEREVLICTERKFIYMARIYEDGEAWPVSNGCGCCGKQEAFTHWMSLPETPKEEE